MVSEKLKEALSAPMTSIEVLAEALNVSYKAAAGMVRRNEIAHVKIGSIYRVRTAPIRQMIGLDCFPPSQAAA